MKKKALMKLWENWKSFPCHRSKSSSYWHSHYTWPLLSSRRHQRRHVTLTWQTWFFTKRIMLSTVAPHYCEPTRHCCLPIWKKKQLCGSDRSVTWTRCHHRHCEVQILPGPILSVTSSELCLSPVELRKWMEKLSPWQPHAGKTGLFLFKSNWRRPWRKAEVV